MKLVDIEKRLNIFFNFDNGLTLRVYFTSGGGREISVEGYHTDCDNYDFKHIESFLLKEAVEETEENLRKVIREHVENIAFKINLIKTFPVLLDLGEI